MARAFKSVPQIGEQEVVGCASCSELLISCWVYNSPHVVD